MSSVYVNAFPSELIGSIIAVFCMAFFYEGLKTLREYLVSLDVRKNRQHMQRSVVNESTPLLSRDAKVARDQPLVETSGRRR